jgi:hypothetical protein
MHLGGYRDEKDIPLLTNSQKNPVVVCPDEHTHIHPWCTGDLVSEGRVQEIDIAPVAEKKEYTENPSCTTFHDTKGRQIVMIVPGGAEIDAVKIFRVDECSQSNGETPAVCFWTKAKPLTPDDNVFIKMGELVEFDSKPTMFGGYDHNESMCVKLVIQYDIEFDKWNAIKQMASPRVRHGVVTVPFSFFQQMETTTSASTSAEPSSTETTFTETTSTKPSSTTTIDVKTTSTSISVQPTTAKQTTVE